MDEITETTLKYDENYDIHVETVEAATMVLEAFDELRQRAAPIAQVIVNLEHGVNLRYAVDEDEIEWDGDHFRYTHEVYRCGCEERYPITIPLSYLFDPNFVDEAREKLKAKQKYEEEVKERERLAQIERNKKRQYEEYLKLKEKFEK